MNRTTGPQTDLDAYAACDAQAIACSEAISAIWPHRLEIGLRNAVGLDAGGYGPVDVVNVEVSYGLIPVGRVIGDVFDWTLACFDAMQEWAEFLGYTILTRNLEPPFRVLRVRNPESGVTVVLKQGRIGNLWTTASSPPVRFTQIAPMPSPVRSHRE